MLVTGFAIETNLHKTLFHKNSPTSKTNTKVSKVPKKTPNNP